MLHRNDHDAIERNRIMISSLCLSMISAQTRFAFVARKNRFPLFRTMIFNQRLPAVRPLKAPTPLAAVNSPGRCP